MIVVSYISEERELIDWDIKLDNSDIIRHGGLSIIIGM